MSMPARAASGRLVVVPDRVVGRRDEIGVLSGLVDAVVAGRGGVAWVEGEPGIGKSALITAGMATAAERGCHLYSSVADELTRRLPLRAILDCLQITGRGSDHLARAEILPTTHTGDGLPLAGDPLAGAAERVLALVERRCAATPVILVIDDLHHADEPSLQVWGQLAALAHQLPLLLVGGLRPAARRSELRQLRHNLTRLDASIITLGPLSVDEVGELATHLIGAPPGDRLRDLLGRAGGNPLHITEVARAVQYDNLREMPPTSAQPVADTPAAGGPDQLPASLANTITDRLAALHPDSMPVLHMAALLGPDCTQSDLATVLDEPVQWLAPVIADAVAAGVLVASGEQITFRHPLFREAIITRLPHAVRAALLRQADQALARSRAPALSEQIGHAGGNPLYVREIVDALTREARIDVDAGIANLVGQPTDVPVSLHAVIGRRLSALSQPTTSVLRIAAILGAAFTAADLGLVARRAPADVNACIDEAVAAGVLTGSPARLAFRHPLIRYTLHESIPASARAALHHEAAKALADAGAPTERVAEQLLAAPQIVDTWMIDWAEQAAPSLTHLDPRIAVDLLQPVSEVVDTADPRRAGLDAAVLTAMWLLGRYEEVAQLAPTVLTRTSDPHVAGPVAWALGAALQRLTRYEQALAATDEAMLQHSLPAVWTARLLALQAVILITGGRYDETEAAVTRAEIEGERAGDRFAVAQALHIRSSVVYFRKRDHAEVLATIDRALAVLGDESETTHLRLMLLGNRVATLDNLGRTAEAVQAIGQALALAEQAGTPPQLATLRLHAAGVYIFCSRWDQALAELDAATEAVLPVAFRLSERGIRALVAVHRDDRPTLSQCLQGIEDLELSAGEARMHADCLLAAWALTAEREGQPEVALHRLRTMFDPDSTGEFNHLTASNPLWLADLVRLALAANDRETARAATNAAEAESERQRLPMASAAARHCRGLLDTDPTQLGAAAGFFGDLGYPLFQAQALENAAVLYAQKGDTTAARAAYAHAIALYTDLDAAWDIRRADARLRPYGIGHGDRGPQGRPTSGWHALTPSEIRIAHLVAAGRPNPDIADELFLSRRTVATHISHILTKLDANSRVDIARQAAANQLPEATSESTAT